jgi:protein-S-isoprenylcysteine O-methyltransferase Ste14
MRKPAAALGSAVFFLLAPGTAAGLVPWLLTRWQVREPLPAPWSWAWAPGRVLGAILLAAGVAVLVEAFVRFVVEGRGTPAPFAAPERLVVGGLYRHVRNPMYVGVLAAVVGQALLLGQVVLLLYAAVLWLPVAAFVRWYEEPALTRRFGADYQAYRRAVPAWWLRLRPWKAGSRQRQRRT